MYVCVCLYVCDLCILKTIYLWHLFNPNYAVQFCLSVTTYRIRPVFSICAIGNSNKLYCTSLLYNHTKFICIHDCLESAANWMKWFLLHIPFHVPVVFLTNGYIFVVSRLPQLAVLAKILCLLMVSISHNLFITFIEIVTSLFHHTNIYIFS